MPPIRLTSRRFRGRILLALVLAGLAALLILCGLPRRPPSLRISQAWQWGSGSSVDPECGSAAVPADLDTGDAFPDLDFSLPDNGGSGFWNRELEERYRGARKSWKDLPLEVIIVPQSHCDPGWLRTYDEYYESSVSRILSNMVQFLNKTSEFKFIWSEVSFFSTWWQRQNKDIRETVIKFLKRNQMEIVTGGWVMTDEATTHSFAIIDQLVEGHQWLKHHTGVTPRHAWSVDVFGHSASLPYILSRAGIQDMVILRSHYAWKAFLAKTRRFDFFWQQAFESSKMLCHMAPSDLYSFKHTCGPDPAICLQYDFRHVNGEFSESTAVDITDQNVEAKAEYLLAQYGRFASLYPHNVLLVPLGDDFRYNFYIEWVHQFENYQKLMGYINNRTEWNAHVRFGTVGDYFSEVNKRLKHNASLSLPTILGDFFPYTDIYADYQPSSWTGFYSTRPFYKKLSLELEHWLRTAEILYSLAKTVVPYPDRPKMIEDYTRITTARQNLALFQHHDAITGTSKASVMVDYGHRLHSSIIDTMAVVSHIAQFLMVEKESMDNVTWTSQVYPDSYRPAVHGLSEKLKISVFKHSRKILLFNSLTKVRSEIIRLKVKSPNLKVLDSSGNDIPIQINPVWNDDFTIASNSFELLFAVTLKPLTFSTITLKSVSEDEIKSSSRPEISLFYDELSTYKNSAFTFKQPHGKHLILESPEIRARFSSSGHINDIFFKKQGVTKVLNIDFLSYVPKKFKSGGYLFNPQTNTAIPINNVTGHYPLVYAIHGSLSSEVTFVNHPFLAFTVRLYSFEGAPSGLHMDVALDISKLPQESEMVMQIASDVKNKGIFFTDSNDLQMLKRTYVTKLPVQGNYYPATSAIFIQDDDFRLNLLIPHSHGVTSPDEGKIEIMLDRRMVSDDARGMGEGIQDNQPFVSTFWLLPEVINSNSPEIPCLSSNAHRLSSYLSHPIVVLFVENIETKLVKNHLSFLPMAWPSDTHLVNLRTLSSEDDYNLPSNSSLLIVCKKQASCKVDHAEHDVHEENCNLTDFSHVNVSEVLKTTLTGVTLDTEDNSRNDVSTRLYTYKISFRFNYILWSCKHCQHCLLLLS